MVFNGIQSVILLLPDERGVFLREQASGMYGTVAYFFGRITSEIPAFIIVPTIPTVITYFVLNLVKEPISVFFIFCKYIISRVH